MGPHSAWSDKEMLTALHLRDHEGLTGSLIAQRLGRSRGAVIGKLNRIDKDADKFDESPHLNGTMKPKWWAR